MGYSGYQVKSDHSIKSNILWLSLTLLLLLPVMVVADDDKSAESNCGQADIRYLDDPSLSRAERIVLMEKAFYDSINRFEACDLANQSASSSANNSGGGNDGHADGLSENSATPSQDMQGTDPALELPPPMAETVQDSASGNTQLPASAQNGAIPEDIPAANNDDAIAAQIRLAAESETDPEIREKLWNEYRKYKGLKVVE